jgi:cation transporter-like permease
MTSNADLLHQPGTLQQPPLAKKKSNLSWIGFFIDLIIFHLLFGWGVAFFGSCITTKFILGIITFFLALLVADYIAVMAYRKKQGPPWKVIFVPLLFIN